jgi:hypothetical protein
MNTKKQGDIGVMQAIFWYTKQGFQVSKPLTDSTRYDLIVDKNGKLFKVEVKTTFTKTKYNIPKVSLRTNGGNQSWNKLVKKVNIKDADILFVSFMGKDIYEIPIRKINDFCTINLGKEYLKYKLL